MFCIFFSKANLDLKPKHFEFIEMNMAVSAIDLEWISKYVEDIWI